MYTIFYFKYLNCSKYYFKISTPNTLQVAFATSRGFIDFSAKGVCTCVNPPFLITVIPKYNT